MLCDPTTGHDAAPRPLPPKTSGGYRSSRNCRSAAAGDDHQYRQPITATASSCKSVTKSGIPEVESITLYSKRGFTAEVPSSRRKRTATGLFSRRRCAILVPQNRLLATDHIGNAFRPLFPLRDGDRTEQTVLPTDFPGRDARLPGALRAADGGALQADNRLVLRQSRA